jgi:hypothetical protein
MQVLVAKIASCVVLTGTLLAAGCGRQTVSPEPALLVYTGPAPKAIVVQAAQEVLSRLEFPIEKLDVEQGIIRTRPWRGAQFFEFWRRDNASVYDVAEANLQTIRRTVELRVAREGPEPKPEDANAPGPWRITCDVSVQRLSLPENQIPSISQTYRMHSQSTATAQRIVVTPQQERAMAWVDSGPDPALAARILRQVSRRLERWD